VTSGINMGRSRGQRVLLNSMAMAPLQCADILTNVDVVSMRVRRNQIADNVRDSVEVNRKMHFQECITFTRLLTEIRRHLNSFEIIKLLNVGIFSINCESNK
jgi:hypothetical protein